jgi:hypothetical protein
MQPGIEYYKMRNNEKGEKMANKDSRSVKRPAQQAGRKDGSGKAKDSWNRPAHQSGHKDGFDNLNSSWQKDQGNMPKDSKSKNGCFPKLFILLLPFIAAGAYLLLRV